MDLLINIDVPDLDEGVAFYNRAFDLVVTRRFGADAAELSGAPVRLYLLRKASDTMGAGDERRRYGRHWTPLHLDFVVVDIEAAVNKAVEAGARVEAEIRAEVWGKIAVMADPFGHGFCLIEFLGRGYDEIAQRQP
jgi:predicted enzyme related to lactoylglutathione lyase